MTHFDRFNTNWQKILFRPDKKSQAAEFNEIQSLINYQNTQVFDYLFSNYRIIKGLQITLDSFTSEGYLMKLSKGQVFIRIENKGYFIDIPETTFLALYNERTYVGINSQFTIATEFRDPLTGGDLCGDLGADRLIASSEIILNADSFPIAVIQGESISNYPYIFYYKEEGYSLQYSNQYVTSLITDYLAQRIYEESGDFIVEGLELGVSSVNTISVAAGKAYIKGRLVELYYPSSFKIDKEIIAQYSVYLTYYGGLVIEKAVPTSKPNNIELGIIERVNSKLQVLSTKARPVTNSDLKLLLKRSRLNQEIYLENILNKQSVDKFTFEDSNLLGIVADSFVNLNNSDINNIDYSASIVSKYGLLRSGLTSNTINFSNLTQVSNVGLDVNSKDALLYIATPIFSENVVMQQNRATGFISLTNSTSKGTIIINPPNGSPNKLTKEYQSLSELEPFNAYQLEVQTPSNVTITSTLETTLVTLEGYGFNSNADNLKVVFGNVQITEFTLSKGTLGTTVSTIKASEDGSFKLTFNVPANLLYKQYTITVSNSNESASILFRDKGNELTTLDYKSSIAQTFTIQAPLMVSKVNLALKRVPQFTNPDINIALVSILKATGDLPNGEVLGQSILKLVDVNLSSDGTAFSPVNFDIPLPLTSTGQYALVIAPLTSGQHLEFYYAEQGKRSLNSTSISDLQPLTGGDLIVKQQNQWVRELSKDLTFQLVQAVPSVSNSEVVYKISNPLGNIHFINRNIKTNCPQATKVEYFYKNVNGSWLPLNPSQPIEGDRSEVDIKLALSGTSNLFPIVLLNQSDFTIHENKKTGTWVSKTIEYRKGYKNVEVEFDYYKPTGTDITVSFSSNTGETWQTIDLDENTVELVNGNIPLSKGTWIVKNLDPTTVSTDINGNTSRILRTKLTLKIEFNSKSPELVPYIMKLKGVVY
jgi:Domain of unknown function (DUF4815)